MQVLQLTMHDILNKVSTIPCQNLTSAKLGWTAQEPILTSFSIRNSSEHIRYTDYTIKYAMRLPSAFARVARKFEDRN